jgi:nitrite reductase/ring-hydroxylating ferredoxin subunit
MAFVKIAAVGEIPEGTGKEVSVAGKTLAVFRTGGRYYALDGICTHDGAPLAEGTCTGTQVECPWHGACFDLASGAVLCPPAPRGVQAYPVQVVGSEVQVEL